MQLVNHNEYQEVISKDLALVVFFAQWCEPCKILDEMLSKLENQYDNIDFFMIDCDENKDLVRELRIISVPTIHIYKKTELLKVIEGLQTEGALKGTLNLYG